MQTGSRYTSAERRGERGLNKGSRMGGQTVISREKGRKLEDDKLTGGKWQELRDRMQRSQCTSAKKDQEETNEKFKGLKVKKR